jgi:hypothetical protein
MNIARFHSHDVQLIDPGAGHDRPVRFAENAPLEEQGPMVVVGNQQGLGQHGTVDPIGAQARAP